MNFTHSLSLNKKWPLLSSTDLLQKLRLYKTEPTRHNKTNEYQIPGTQFREEPAQ